MPKQADQQRHRQQQQQQQPHLPHELLTMVLQRIKPRQRLCRCSLVCQAWRAAAAAATTDITHELAARRSSSLTQWLLAHGSNLSNLSLTSLSDNQLLCLPYAQLTQLRSCLLQGFSLAWHPAAAGATVAPGPAAGCTSHTRKQMQIASISKHAASGSASSSSSSSSNPLSHLSSLTKLSLSHVAVDCFSQSLRSLSALTALQDLTLGKGIRVPGDGGEMQQQRGAGAKFIWVPHAKDVDDQLLCLQQLTQLTHIEAQPCLLPRAAVAPFSALEQLQRLQLNGSIGQKQATLLAKLPTSLTHVDFGWHSEQPVGQCADISSLTALQHLKIWKHACDRNSCKIGGLDPLLLSGMQQLRVLHVHWMVSDALPALLQVMPQLSSLRELDLDCGAVKALPASEAFRYSDLLPASAHLFKVVLRGTSRMLPDAGYGCHLFAGRQLPALQQLLFGWDMNAGDDAAETPEDLPAAFLDDVGIYNLAACCPALRSLALPGCVTEEAQLAPLLQLTALTELSLAGDEISDEFAEEQIALLSNLRQLHVSLGSELTDAGVAHFTALTRLRGLRLYYCSISEGLSDADEEGDLVLRNKKSTGETVPQLLRKRCRRAALLQALEDEEEEGGMDQQGALQALLGGHCASCEQLQEQLITTQTRADCAEAMESTAREVLLKCRDVIANLKTQLAAAQAENRQLRALALC